MKPPLLCVCLCAFLSAGAGVSAQEAPSPSFAQLHEESMRRALKEFPELGVADSSFNKAFWAYVKTQKESVGNAFADPQWPYRFAVVVGRSLALSQAQADPAKAASKAPAKAPAQAATAEPPVTPLRNVLGNAAAFQGRRLRVSGVVKSAPVRPGRLADAKGLELVFEEGCVSEIPLEDLVSYAQSRQLAPPNAQPRDFRLGDAGGQAALFYKQQPCLNLVGRQLELEAGVLVLEKAVRLQMPALLDVRSP